VAALRDIQQAIQAYVLCGDRGAESGVQGTPRVDARTRLEIYAKGYRLRLLEALQEDYPALRARMGEEAFGWLAEGYIDAHPSTYFSLRYFGQHLPGDLSGGEHAGSPWLAELATFEWALGEAFDAPGAAVVMAEALSSVAPTSWPELGLTLHPSVRRLSLGWNVSRIRQAIDDGQPPPAPEAFESMVPWLVWRQGLGVYYRSLTAAEASSLDRARQGESFGALCEGLCAFMSEDEVALRAAGFLRRWVTDGLVAAIRVPS
jgi:hypothetical protein